MLPSHHSADREVGALQDRARRRRQRFTRSRNRAQAVLAALPPLGSFQAAARSVPLRFTLHLLVGLLVPAAALLGGGALSYGPLRQQPGTQPAADRPQSHTALDFLAPLAPLGLRAEPEGEAPAPDSAFAAIDALPVPPLTADLLAIRPVSAVVAAERATLRGGPGSEYDPLGELPAGASLRLVAQHGDWYQAQTPDARVVWVAAELLDADPFAADVLPAPLSIPAPPPPKVAQVLAEGLNLRDGPGTNYVGMVRLPAGAQLDLLARYQGWFQVQTGDGQVGWVTSEFLAIGAGVAERVEAVTQIPDPNPALVGLVREAKVNLRSGPGTAYGKVGALGAGTQLDLLARHKDWLKVRTPQGGEGWVATELLDISPFVARRVPQARAIPPLPRGAQRQRGAGGIRGVQFAPAEATSGPAAFALQFVGARYVWGGASPERGFDCSGFTRYVYGQFGLRLPHSSAGQYSTSYGTAVANPADLQVGDLVFFVNTYRRGISHVGIYIGGGNVVQALSPGRGVGIASLASGYWAAHYYGAIRPNR
ncbi:MAG TPA: SH3 domain-containing protein [Roseiflexaceae bacterium]|nr:SH3 domain-containing protein [Roseiflexaceae bacterium]